MIDPAFEILNQRGTPMFFSDVFANRPTAGIVGRIFISTDTYAFYRDTGSGWDLIGGPGSGTITGSGTIGTLPIWNGTQVIGDSSLLEGASKFTTTKDFQADGYYLSGMTAGSGALYWTSDRVTLANYNPTGDVHIEVAGGQAAQVVLGSNLSTTFYGNIIRNGGLSTQFLKADGSLDSSSYVTTNIYNGNGTLSGNRVVTLNSNYLSFAGGQTYIGSQTASSGLLTINNASADAHLQVVGASAPSIRIDNAGTGATQRLVFGLATATNNFIQGSTAGDICISTASSSPLLFGMWQTINATEVMRISTTNNLIVGSTTDNGNRLQVNGNVSATGNYQGLNGSLSGYLQIGSTHSVKLDITQSLSYDGIRIISNNPTTQNLLQLYHNDSYGVIETTYLGSGAYKNLCLNTQGGNLLIGSTTDIGVSKLQVTGNGNFTGSVSATGLYGYILRGRSSDNYGAFGFYSNDGLTRYGYIQSHSTNGGQLAINADGGGQLIMDSRGNIFNTGKVGIATGATAPSSFLQIKGGSGNQLTLDNSGERYTQISFLNNSSASKGAIWLDNTNSLFELYCGFGISQTFYSSANERMRIFTTGNISINSTTDTGQKLYLNGSLRIDGQLSATAGGSSGQHLIINCDGTTYKIALLNN